MMLFFRLQIIVFVLFLLSCSDQKAVSQDQFSKKEGTYDFSMPSETIHLTTTLSEISGLFYWDSKSLGAIQDEMGIVYRIDINDGKILTQIRFGNDGDFEGITKVDDVFYALKSNGNLYQFSKSSPKAIKYDTELDEINNCEGICYDKTNNSLLIACKGFAGTNENDVMDGKAIYRYDLLTMQLKDNPEILIESYELKKNTPSIKKKVFKAFAPSGICIHPITQETYVLSHKGKLLVIFDAKKRLLKSIHLPKHLFPQPEGICFAPNGDLFISNEGGKNAKPTLLKFKY